MRGVTAGPKARAGEVGEYTPEELVALREALEERERQLAEDPKFAAMAGAVGGAAIDLTYLRQEGKSSGAKRELEIVEKEIVRLRSENATRSTTINSLQRELDELLETGVAPAGSGHKLPNMDRDEVTKKLLLKREEALTHELSSVRSMYEMAKQQHSAALSQRELIVDGLKTDLMAVRKQLSTAEKDAANLRKEAASRETEVAAEASSAKAAADALGLTVQIDDDLIETDFGEWEGLTFLEAAERHPELHGRWLRDTSLPPPGGESFDQVQHRIERARDRIIAEHGPATVLVVSHVTPIKTLLRLALGAGSSVLYRLHLDLASLSIAEFYPDDGASVRLVNDTSYLRG
jgi:broad specificity phosphatase PhoE